jgi:hypothetical protein
VLDPYHQRAKVDRVTVAAELQRADNERSMSGSLHWVPSDGANASEYWRIVAEAAARRGQLAVAAELTGSPTMGPVLFPTSCRISQRAHPARPGRGRHDIHKPQLITLPVATRSRLPRSARCLVLSLLPLNADARGQARVILTISYSLEFCNRATPR